MFSQELTPDRTRPVNNPNTEPFHAGAPHAHGRRLPGALFPLLSVSLFLFRLFLFFFLAQELGSGGRFFLKISLSLSPPL